MASDAAIGRALAEAAEREPAPGFVAMLSRGRGADRAWAFGRCKAGASEAMTADAVFWIASFTKLVTTVAALALIEDGLFGLDTPVAELRPDFADLPILEGFDASGVARLRRATDRPAVRHLLTHTSGLGYAFMDADLARVAQADGLGPEDGHLRPRLFTAGADWRYGTSTDWLGLVVETASGRTLDEVFADKVFRPLAMTETTFTPSDGLAARTAAMHSRLPDGSAVPIEFRTPQGSAGRAGGGLYSTASDYMRLLRALLDGAILSDAHRAALFANAVGNLEAGAITSSSPAFTNDYDPMPGQPKRWSLGLMVNPEPGRAGRPAGCAAWAGLANCYYWIDPVNGLAGLVLSQILPFADPKMLALFTTFEQSVYR